MHLFKPADLPEAQLKSELQILQEAVSTAPFIPALLSARCIELAIELQRRNQR